MGIASLGIDFGLISVGLWVGWVNPMSPTQAELVHFTFLEERPDLGEVGILSRRVITSIPPDVQQVLTPWANYTSTTSFWPWTGWRHGNDLYFSYSADHPPLHAGLGEGGAMVVSPALETSKGIMDVDVDVAVLSKTENALRILRLMSPKDPVDGKLEWRVPAKVEWLRSWKLDFTPVAARSFLAPKKLGSARKVVLLESQSGGVGVHLYDIDNSTDDLRVLIVPKVYALPGSEPGAYVDDKGTSHVSFVASASADLKQLVIVDTHFPAKATDKPTSEVQRLRAIADVPTDTAVAFQARADRPMRRDWVVAMRDGSLLHESQERAMRTDRPVVLPLNVVRMSQATYVLTADKTGPWLEMLR